MGLQSTEEPSRLDLRRRYGDRVKCFSMPIAMEDGAALCQRCLIVLGVVEVNASDVVQVSNDMPNLDAGSKERTGACTLQAGLCRGIF